MDRLNELAGRLRLLIAARTGVHPDRLDIKLEFSLPTSDFGPGHGQGWTARAQVFHGASKEIDSSSFSTPANQCWGYADGALQGLVEEIEKSFSKREPEKGKSPVMLCSEDFRSHVSERA